jgi:hypothetical protein
VKRLKILIHGQELDTLAGHVDLTQFFIVDTKAAQQGAVSLDTPVNIAVPPVASANNGATVPSKR